MIEINWSDVYNVLNQIRGHLICLGIVIVLAIAAMIACKNMSKAKKFLIRCEAGVAMVLALAIVANLICLGPMANILSLVTAGTQRISEETGAAAQQLCETVAEEGIVLLENKSNVLPLVEQKLNVFGWSSTNPCYGGTGSGAMNDTYHIVDLLEGLQNAGIQTNEELSKFYTDYRADRPEVGMWDQDWTLPEPPASTYSQSLIDNAKAFSSNALVVLTRSGGEHIDLPTDVSKVNYTNNSTDYADFPTGTHYLGLSQSERDMIDLVCANFDNVVVVLNSANTLELGWVSDYAQIKGLIWCPSPGQNGFNGLGRILTGEVNPSGRNADTLVMDLTKTPTWNNFHDFEYDNMEEFRISADDLYMPNNLPHFTNYVEGIYIGYRFYETAAVEGLITYDDVVAYPFGYGLSYTTFSQEMGPITEQNGKITFDVTVTNTGAAAGKDVVEVYYNPPYYNGGIEKSAVNLIAFEKTGELAPGASENVTIEFAVEDMASYDTYGEQCYVLDAGEYVISINADAHTVIDSQSYNVAQKIVYNEANARSTDAIAAVNAFVDFAEGDVTYLSRADGFANYAQATAAPASLSMSEPYKATFTNNSNWAPEADPDAVMPTTNAKNGLTLASMRGLAYDDAAWEPLLDQLTIDDMVNLVALGGFQTVAAKSVGKIATVDCDGPAAVNNTFTGVGSIGFPCAVMIANTWNVDIAYAFGDGIGTMAEEMDVDGWYAPAMNIHRNAFTGRNFEYYSEDGLLSGKIASQAVQGAGAHGVYAYIKHFALNEMESSRWGMLCTWSTEQALRETYFKPFEICVKDNLAQGGGAAGHPLAVMSSYNYIGNQWAGACNSLLQTVLRDEWGYRGLTLTDYFASFGYMDAKRSIYNGGSMCLINMDAETNFIKDTDAVTVREMRDACHDIFYTTVNSRAYESDMQTTGLPTWQVILITVDVILAAAVILVEVLVIRKGYQKRK